MIGGSRNRKRGGQDRRSWSRPCCCWPAATRPRTAPPRPPRAPPPPEVTVAKPLIRRLTEWDEFTGRFEPVQVVEIKARVPGLPAGDRLQGRPERRGRPGAVHDRPAPLRGGARPRQGADRAGAGAAPAGPARPGPRRQARQHLGHRQGDARPARRRAERGRGQRSPRPRPRRARPSSIWASPGSPHPSPAASRTGAPTSAIWSTTRLVLTTIVQLDPIYLELRHVGAGLPGLPARGGQGRPALDPRPGDHRRRPIWSTRRAGRTRAR